MTDERRTVLIRSRRSPAGAAGLLASLFPLLGIPVAVAAQEGGSADPDSAVKAPADVETSPAETASAGLYTETQAARGEAVFRARCSACHVPSQFRGEAFLFQWAGRTAFDLVDQLRATMPYEAPGGLPLREYVDIVAYLLRLNRYAAGEEELPEEDERLKEIRIPERRSSGKGAGSGESLTGAGAPRASPGARRPRSP